MQLPVQCIPACRPLVLLPVLLGSLAVELRAAPLQVPPEHAVNPFTGVPLSLEQARWALEQSRLEEQLQASLLNRRKLEGERQRLETGSLPPAPPVMLRPGPAPASVPAPAPVPLAVSLHPPVAAPDGLASVTPLAAAPLPARRIRSHPVVRPAAADAAGLRVAPVAPPTIVGVRQMQGGWCVLLQQSTGLQPVCPGQSIQGQSLQAVTAQGYQLGGVQHALEVGPILLAPQHAPAVGAAQPGAAPGAVQPAAAPGASPAEWALGAPGALLGVVAERQ